MEPTNQTIMISGNFPYQASLALAQLIRSEIHDPEDEGPHTLEDLRALCVGSTGMLVVNDWKHRDDGFPALERMCKAMGLGFVVTAYGEPIARVYKDGQEVDTHIDGEGDPVMDKQTAETVLRAIRDNNLTFAVYTIEQCFRVVEMPPFHFYYALWDNMLQHKIEDEAGLDLALCDP